MDDTDFGISQSCFSLPECAVDIWVIHPDSGLSAEPVLSDAERIRFGRLSDLPRRRRMATRAAVRRVLSGYLHIDPAMVPIVEDGRGKPSLAEYTDVSFSVSHTDDISVLGVTKAYTNVGIDIEAIGRTARRHLPTRALTPREGEMVNNASAEMQEGTFMRYWTAKEAYAKVVGAGLALDFRAIRVCDMTIDPTLTMSEVNGLKLAHFYLSTGIVGAVVVGKESWSTSSTRTAIQGQAGVFHANRYA